MGNSESGGGDCLATAVTKHALYLELDDQHCKLQEQCIKLETKLARYKSKNGKLQKQILKLRATNKQILEILTTETQHSQELEEANEFLQEQLLGTENGSINEMDEHKSTTANVNFGQTFSGAIDFGNDDIELPSTSVAYGRSKSYQNLVSGAKVPALGKASSTSGSQIKKAVTFDLEITSVPEINDADVKSESDSEMDFLTSGSEAFSFSKLATFRETINLSSEFDAAEDAKTIYNWLHNSNVSVNETKVRIAEILTARNYRHRKEIVFQYEDKYSKDLFQSIKKVLKRGNVLKLISGLLISPAEYDAILLHNAIRKNDTENMAEFICTHTVRQIKGIEREYKRKYKHNLGTQFVMVAHKEKKNTMKRIFEEYFEYKLNDKKFPDSKLVAKDIDFLRNYNPKNKEAKTILGLMLVNNNNMYVRELEKKWQSTAHESLEAFLKKHLFKNILTSTTARVLMVRLKYALDPAAYFAEKIRDYCLSFRSNRDQIGEVLIARFDKNLNAIQVRFGDLNLGDGKSMSDYIEMKSGSSKFGFFLCQILSNCGKRKSSAASSKLVNSYFGGEPTTTAVGIKG